MDTPERSGAPVSKFEDSPVFNFINSLSPIQPVKSVHSVQAYTSPGFSSISSIFSSPHVNLQKESRFLIRQPYSESLKQENSSEVGDGSNQCPGVPYATEMPNCTVAAEDSSNIKCSLNEATVEPPDDCSTIPSSSSLPQNVQYNCGSPEHHITPSYGNTLDLKLNVGCAQVELVQFNQDGLDRRKSLFAGEVAGDGIPTEQSEEEVPGCDWEDLISNDPDNLLIFDESNESKGCADQVQKSGDKDATLSTVSANFREDNADDSEKAQVDASFGPCLENTAQDPPAVLGGDFGEHDESDKTPQIDADTDRNQTGIQSQFQQTGNEISDSLSSHDKVDFQQRGMRRRCLVFDVSGHSKRSSLNDLKLYPSDSLPSNGKFSSGSKHLLPMKRVASTSPHVLPGIGLHLNTLASTSKDKSVTPEMPASGRQAIGMQCSIGFIPPRTAKHELADDETLDPIGNELQDLQVVLHDGLHSADLENREGPGPSSPKKKRRKSETGDGETCKRCNCKKSKCLKLYCECFAAGVYCIESCSCQGCYNKPIHEETVLATRKLIETRNPLAFAPKVIHTSEAVQDSGEEANKTPASARHKRGCNCKKSSCLKKYCECYQGGVGCSPSCRCEGCKNAFGRKDGLPLMGTEEIVAGGEEMNACEKEKDKPDEIQENAVVRVEHQPSESILLATPLQICRTSGKLPLFSSGKPPRSSTLPIGYSPLSNACQGFRKAEIPLPQRKLGKNAKTVPEDDTPEILRDNASPNSCVKTASPNGKRVSSPHSGIGLSPSCKGGRKLILKSIPSFPSLSTDVGNDHSVNRTGSSFSSSG